MSAYRALALAAAGGLVLPAVAATTAHAAETDVLFVHAFGEEVVDVYIDGDLVLEGFALDGADNPASLGLEAGTTVQFLVVPTGTDVADLFGEEDPAEHEDPAEEGDPAATEDEDPAGTYLFEGVEIPEFASSLVLTHGPQFEPVIVVFEDFVDALCDDEGVIILRHTAAEPATVDLGFNGEIADGGEGVTFGEELAYGAPPGIYELNLWEAGTPNDAYGTPVDFDLEAGVVLAAYPYNDPAGPTSDVLFIGYDVATVACEDDEDGGDKPKPRPADETPKPVPTSVPAGHTPGGGGTPVAGLIALLGAVAMAMAAVALRGRRA